jgi:transcriptional regulator with XRE-family HTH domain
MNTSVTSYSSLIKYLREERGLSQEVVAKQSKMSRASYVAVEKGTKELTLAEAEAVTKMFGITIDELLRTQAPDHAKYTQMILALLRNAKKNSKTVKKTKLAKLLYLADFSWYYLHKKSMSGVAYRKIEFGPVADVYFRLLEEMEQGGVINIKQIYRDDYHMYEIEETRASEKTALNLLTKKEQTHLANVWKQWQEALTSEIVKFTHEQAPYKETFLGQIISYELITKEDAYMLY